MFGLLFLSPLDVRILPQTLQSWKEKKASPLSPVCCEKVKVEKSVKDRMFEGLESERKRVFPIHRNIWRKSFLPFEDAGSLQTPLIES